MKRQEREEGLGSPDGREEIVAHTQLLTGAIWEATGPGWGRVQRCLTDCPTRAVAVRTERVSLSSFSPPVSGWVAGKPASVGRPRIQSIVGT